MKTFEVTIRAHYNGPLDVFAKSHIEQYLTGLFQLAKLDLFIEGIKEVRP